MVTIKIKLYCCYPDIGLCMGFGRGICVYIKALATELTDNLKALLRYFTNLLFVVPFVPPVVLQIFFLFISPIIITTTGWNSIGLFFFWIFISISGDSYYGRQPPNGENTFMPIRPINLLKKTDFRVIFRFVFPIPFP